MAVALPPPKSKASVALLLTLIASSLAFMPMPSHPRWRQVVPTVTLPTRLHATKSQEKLNMTQTSQVWEWKHGWRIYWESQGSNGPPLLLIPGFGVGTFHYERNLGALAEAGNRVWAVDLLGQGRSWPTQPPRRDHGLVYSVDLWTEQLHSFIREVIGEPVYLVGNSLGGFLSMNLAALHGDWVKGVVLLNATPFWAFLPNRKRAHSLVKSVIPWDGTLPAPEPLYRIGSTYFDQLRDPKTIETMLKAVYANPKAFSGTTLVEDIMRPTQNPMGHEAFTSILFAPKPEHKFEELLAMAEEVPLLLVYGREDPWVAPPWGQSIKRRRPDATYYELSPCGHSPHHEAPIAINTLINEWVGAQEEGLSTTAGKDPLEPRCFEEPFTREVVTATLQDGNPRSHLEWVAAGLL